MFRLFRKKQQPIVSRHLLSFEMGTEKRVAAGAAVLDKMHPGWEQKINTGTLDIVSPVHCVLGQLYGRFGLGIEELTMDDDVSSRDAAVRFSAYGFGFGMDTPTWINLVNERQLARSA